MGKTVVVQYETKPDQADENQRLVEDVFAQLAERQPDGLRYATFRLEDGVTFVHVAIVEGDADPLPETPAFTDFQKGIPDRVAAPPTPTPATLVGQYGFFGS